MIEKRFKVPGGKLIVIKKLGDRIKIQGDFFLHPEEVLENLEELASTCPLKDLKGRLNKFIREEGVVLVGLTEEDLCNLIREVRE